LTRRVPHTIIGKVLALGVMNVSVRKLRNRKEGVVGATKRKVLGDAVSAILKRTTAGHYAQFISDTLNIMNVFLYMKDFHLATDIVSIHSPDFVDPVPFFEFLGLFGQRIEPLWKSK
jgi:hypothetical protein